MKQHTLYLCVAMLFATLASYALPSQVISIESENKAIYLLVEESGRVRQTYFGDKLSDATPFTTLYGSTAIHKKDAYPTFGTGYTGEVALKLTHADGNMTTRLVYESHTTESLLDGALVETKVRLKDEYYPLYVTLIYKAYQQENVLTVATLIENGEKKPIRLEGVASAYLSMQADSYWLTRFKGSWADEMKLVETPIEAGITTIDSKLGVRTTQQSSPSFILSFDQQANETMGEVILGSLAWSGNYKLSFEVNNAHTLQLLAGVNDFLSDYTLAPKEQFETPELVLAHSTQGVGEASRNLHRWVRRYNLQDGNDERPVVLNSWEGAYFSFDEEVIKTMITNAASMGVEVFVLDDGWFGNKYPRNNDKAGLGDWEVNTQKLPNGIEALVDHARSEGIRFGIWVEPEMVNPQSELAERHPDWIVTSPHRTPLPMRSQLLLDLTNPKVQEFVYEVVAKLLRSHPEIAYIKWDANRHVEDFGSSYLDKEKQSHFWIDYINALYVVYERLTTDFPDVIFQACSSGGGRVDYGSIKYHHEFWASDNTDGESRTFINWGMSYFMPSQAVASHVSMSPNHQTGNITPIKFRFDVAMAQRLGVELQPTKLTPAELAWTKEGIALYKQIRPIVQLGDQYRLISPYANTGYTSLMYVDEQQDKAVLFAYSLDFHMRDGDFRVKLQGLDPNKKYRVNELMPNRNNAGKPAYKVIGENKILSGDYLMQQGLHMKLYRRNESAVVQLTVVE